MKAGTELKIEIIPKTGSPAFGDLLKGRKLIEGTMRGVALYPEGTEEGRHAVGIFVELPDGTIVHAQTTGRLFLMANGALQGSMARVGETEGDWKQ